MSKQHELPYSWISPGKRNPQEIKKLDNSGFYLQFSVLILQTTPGKSRVFGGEIYRYTNTPRRICQTRVSPNTKRLYRQQKLGPVPIFLQRFMA